MELHERLDLLIEEIKRGDVKMLSKLEESLDYNLLNKLGSFILTSVEFFSNQIPESIIEDEKKCINYLYDSIIKNDTDIQIILKAIITKIYNLGL